MSETSIYIVESRGKFRGFRRDTVGPFDRFYLVKESDIDKARQLTPFAMIVPLNQNYATMLKVRGLDFNKLMNQGYQVVVPILMTRVTGARGTVTPNEVRPTYMTKKGWARHWTRVGDYIPDDVRMITPDGILNPMCASCENSLMHLSGECRVGGASCLVTLKLASPTMDEGKRARSEPKEHESLALIHKLNKAVSIDDRF